MATLYKSEKRDEMVKEGYRIRGNSGDQWSDLLGSSISQRSFKLPNPMYYIPWRVKTREHRVDTRENENVVILIASRL